jgi:hypothetical protein
MNENSPVQGLPVHLGIVERICALEWAALDRAELSLAAWAYYYFSIQFRENLEIAHSLHPNDTLLRRLVAEECDTDNLSPWPDVAAPGEKLNHDEFMRRLLTLEPIDPGLHERVARIGMMYLARVRAEDAAVRAASIATYEDGGLEQVFRAILRNQHWDTPLLAAFRHFLIGHIGFDSNPDQGHGALARHLMPDHRVRRLWDAFHDLFVLTAPRLTDVGP